MGIKSIENDQKLQSNFEEDKLELKDTLSHEVLKDC